MNFEKLTKLQPKVVDVIQNSIAMNRLVQVILFEGAKGTPKKDAAYFLASLLLCENKSACLNCRECRRIASGIHPRVYFIDVIDKTIKKEQIQDLEYEISKSGLEEGTRVIIINNIDKATSSASNSLLKFLEEMKEDVYCILITDNISGVLSTIKSRSQIISFQRISENELIEEYSEKGIDYEVGKVLSKITNDVSEGMKLIEEGYLLDIIDLVKDINYSFFTGSDPVIVFNEKGKFLLDIADRMYHQIFLDLLVLITNDRLYHLLGKYDEIVFKNNISSIGNIYDIPYQNTFKQMEKIIEYKQRVLYNVNLELLYMSLFVEMRKIND